MRECELNRVGWYGATALARRLGALAVMLLLGSSTAWGWQTTRFGDSCWEEETQELIEEAHEFLYEHLDDLWAEVDRPGAAVHEYKTFGDERRVAFAASLERLKVHCDDELCEGTGTLAALRGIALPGDLGELAGAGTNLLLCVDNILELNEGLRHASPLGVVSAYLGYGAMLDSYGALANVSSSADKATSIAEAIHNMILTPDFAVDITSVRVDSGQLLVVIDMENVNPHSAGSMGQSISGAIANDGWSLGLRVNGELALSGASLDSLEPEETQWLNLYVEPGEFFDPTLPEQEIEVEVDLDGVYHELDESNNVDRVTFSPYVDLAITHFELAAPYETVSRSEGGPGKGGGVAMRRITFDAVVENLSVSNDAGEHTIVWTAPERVGRAGFESVTYETTQTVLAASASKSLSLSAEVPVDLDGASYTLRLSVDPGGQVLDPDRSNNILELVIDEDWFRPDYTVALDAFDLLDGGDVLVTGRVRNIGPEPGGRTTLRYENWDGRVFAQRVQPLPVLAEIPFQFDAQREDAEALLIPGDTHEVRLEVDRTDTVEENNELNNQVLLSFKYGVDLSDLRSILRREFDRDDLFPLDITFAPWVEHELGGRPGALQPGPWLEPSASGPFLPPIEVLTGQTALGNVLVVARQWSRGLADFRTWGRRSLFAVEALRVDLDPGAGRGRRPLAPRRTGWQRRPPR